MIAVPESLKGFIYTRPLRLPSYNLYVSPAVSSPDEHDVLSAIHHQCKQA